MKKYLIALFVLSFTFISYFNFFSKHGEAAISSEIDRSMNIIIQQIQDLAKNDPDLAISSNPYDYIKNNPEFDNIVNLGTQALPVIIEKIDNSSHDGLVEYILSIAAEKISKVDLKKKEKFQWQTAKQFSKNYKEYVKEVPKMTEDIITSKKSSSDKVNELTDLGVVAIPYILDGIEAGHNDISPALERLTDITIDGKDKFEWMKENKHKYEHIRNLKNL